MPPRLTPFEKSKRARQRALAKKAKENERAAKKALKAKQQAAEEKMVAFSVRLPKSVHAQLKAMAKAQKRSANRQIEMLIQQASSGQSVAVQSAEPKASDAVGVAPSPTG